MTPQREEYLTKCSGKERILRHLIDLTKNKIKQSKAVLNGKKLPPISLVSIVFWKQEIYAHKFILKGYQHELNYLKKMDRVTMLEKITKHPQFNIGYAVCKCGNMTVLGKKYCSKCGKRYLWEKVK